MGGEFGQWKEWAHEGQLDWDLTQLPDHAGMQRWITDLNRAYREKAPLHELDFSGEGFQWVDNHDSDNSILSFLRLDEAGRPCLCVCNFTPVVRESYHIGVPQGGRWREVLNSDAPFYGGSGVGNMGGVAAADTPFHGRPHSLTITLPPLAMVMFEPEGEA
jgi:1,4-alpha-glucan branching enzyme